MKLATLEAKLFRKKFQNKVKETIRISEQSGEWIREILTLNFQNSIGA